MKARHHQQGHVFLHGKAWYLRYRIPEVQPDGSFKNAQKCQPLVKYGEQYRSKRAVQDLADEFLAPYNNNRASLLSGATLNYWMEKHHLPMIKESRKASTYPDYFNKWNWYVRPHGEIPLRDFRTGDGQEMLRAISREHDLSRTTLGHIKSLVSGAFTCAIRQDVLRGNNPMRYVEVPSVRGPEDTYAYSLEEIMAMLQVLDGMAATVVAVASFTGPRDSELRGLRWEDYEGKEIFITRSVWRGIVDETKTKASKAPVRCPVAFARRAGWRLCVCNRQGHASGLADVCAARHPACAGRCGAGMAWLSRMPSWPWPRIFMGSEFQM